MASDLRRFAGRCVFITGGASGMGARHARAFVAEGANVVIADVATEDGGALAAELGHQAMVVPLDVRDEGAWVSAVGSAEEAFGPVSVLVNNAGVLHSARIEHTDLADWQRVLDVNLTGVFLGLKTVIPSLRRCGGGSVVNVSSATGFMATPKISAYGASKWAVRGLTRAAAAELGRDSIRVNSVHPGVVRTPMVDAMIEGDGGVAIGLPRFAISRPAEPEEITRVVLFLASDEASFITGSELVADGGMVLGPSLQYRDETAVPS